MKVKVVVACRSKTSTNSRYSQMFTARLLIKSHKPTSSSRAFDSEVSTGWIPTLCADSKTFHTNRLYISVLTILCKVLHNMYKLHWTKRNLNWTAELAECFHLTRLFSAVFVFPAGSAPSLAHWRTQHQPKKLTLRCETDALDCGTSLPHLLWKVCLVPWPLCPALTQSRAAWPHQPFTLGVAACFDA